MNWAVHVTCTILKLVAASAAEAELGALFLNAQEAKVIRLVLEELGHPQSPTPIHIDNTTTVGILTGIPLWAHILATFFVRFCKFVVSLPILVGSVS
jgi:hypothetical protein